MFCSLSTNNSTCRKISVLESHNGTIHHNVRVASILRGMFDMIFLTFCVAMLQAINPLGRELALARGANVVMPIMTPTEERANYQLYPGKPCVSHTADGCASCLKMRIASVGKTLQTDGGWADPPHFRNPIANGKHEA